MKKQDIKIIHEMLQQGKSEYTVPQIDTKEDLLWKELYKK